MTLRTEQFCAASGWTVERGHRYRITLSTSAVDPWFDQAIPTDVFGFPSDSFRHWSALPLKRWWGQNWFKPIVRIGRRGNDEYVLDPLGEADKRERPVCVDALQPRPRLPVRAKIGADLKARLLECSTTPADRVILSSEFTARSAGELFLYVNDAELVIPGMYNLFYQNNSGSAEVTFERVKNSGNSELARSWSPRGVGSTEK